MGINIEYPRKFTDLRQVYSHLYQLTETLNAQMNSITPDSFAPELARSVGLIEERNRQAEQTEDSLKTRIASSASQARKAYVFNLLDNTDFLHPVNQRGLTTYTVNGYTIDRWRTMTDAASVKVTSGGIELGDGVALRQYVNGDTSGTLTLAVCDGEGNVYTVTGNLANGTIWGDKMQLAMDDNGLVYFLLYDNNTFRWAALYRGAYTRDTLPAYAPKGYASELLECQRYFIRMRVYRVAGQTITTGARFAFTLPTAMRITPTLKLVTAGTMICNGVQDVAVTGATLQAIEGNRAAIYTTHTTQGTWSLQTGTWASGVFELSADL